MPLQLNRIWHFTRKTATGFISKFRKPSAAASPSGKLYRSINELPLHKFIDCYIDNNLHALIIEGKATDAELENAWAQLSDQYTTAAGDAEYRIYLDLYKEVIALAADLQTAEALIGILQQSYSKEINIALNELVGTSVLLEGMSTETYQKQLAIIYKRSRALKLKYDLKMVQFEAMQKKFTGDKSEKPTRDYFDSMLITLSDHAGYQLTDRISTYEYCERLKRLQQYISKNRNKR